MSYIPNTDADRAEMLSVIGKPSIDDLFADVPARPGGQLRHLEMKHYNKSGYSFPGGPVSEPRARWKICARGVLALRVRCCESSTPTTS